MSKMYPVKPFYAEYCQKCMHNGCYPWNRNPLLLCSNMGGWLPAVEIMEEDVSHQCLQYKRVDFGMWQSHLQELIREAADIERMRRKSIDGATFTTNQILPAESVELLKEKAE